MNEKARNSQLKLEVFKEMFVIGMEGKQWIEKALQVTDRYKIPNRLGFSHDSVEGFLAATFLGIRLLKQYQGQKKEMLRQAELSGQIFVRHIFVSVDSSQWGINGLEKAAEQISEQSNISLNKKNMIEISINALTAEYFHKAKPGLFSSEVKFNPDKKLLDKWGQRWKPEFFNK